MDERDARIQLLEAQVAALTQERDDLSAIVWGKIRGGVPNAMGGQAKPQDKCALCGGDCTGQTPNLVYGVRYCDTCVQHNSNASITMHARAIMQNAGAAIAATQGQKP